MKEILILFILTTLLYIVFWLIKLSVKIDYKENLTMEEKPIKITIENYCGQIITFTMSSNAEVESSLCIEDSFVTGIHINAYDKDILIEKEDI